MKSKIRSDSHGLYVRTNGSVYRPVKAKYSYSTLEASDLGWTIFLESEAVRVSHVSQSPFCRVKHKTNDKMYEFWHSHGSYIGPDGKNINSEFCWQPDEVSLATITDKIALSDSIN